MIDLMRNLISILLALVIAVAAGAGFYVIRKSAANQAEGSAAKAEAEKAARELEQEKAQRLMLEQQRDKLIKVADDVGSELRRVTSNAVAKAAVTGDAAPVEKGKPALGKIMSQMMSDPDTRKFLREQQRVATEQLYNPLVRKLGLTAEEGAEFKRMLLDRTLANSEKAMSFMGGDEAGAKALSTLAEDQKALEEDIRTFLGESRYAEYQRYQETVGERTQLNMFRQSDPVGQSLNEDQADRLLAIMAEEKKAVQESLGTVFPGANQDPAMMQKLMKEDHEAKLIEAQELLNQHVYNRAEDLLSQEQLEGFARFQTNQLQMLRLGLKMARQMFEQ